MTPKVKEEISKKCLDVLSLRAWMLVCFSILPLNHEGNVGGGGKFWILIIKTIPVSSSPNPKPPTTHHCNHK